MHRIEWLQTRYGEELSQKLKRDGLSFTSDAAVKHFSDFDPTITKRFTQWLIAAYLKKGYLFEDLPKAKITLASFKKYNQRIPSYERDINYHNTLASLCDVIAVVEKQNNNVS